MCDVEQDSTSSSDGANFTKYDVDRGRNELPLNSGNGTSSSTIPLASMLSNEFGLLVIGFPVVAVLSCLIVCFCGRVLGWSRISCSEQGSDDGKGSNFDKEWNRSKGNKNRKSRKRRHNKN